MVHRRQALVVQRTGWGKSAVYFIAAKLMRQAGQGLGWGFQFQEPRFIAAVATGTVAGFGVGSYLLALRAVAGTDS